jgi:PAS domain S-box-containing protein
MIDSGEFTAYIYKDDHTFALEQLNLAMKDKEAFSTEFRIMRSDGAVRWIENSVSIHRNQHFDVMRLVGAVRDITERKNREVAMQESVRIATEAAQFAEMERRRLNAVLEAVPVGIGLADADGKLTMINPVNRQIWGDFKIANNVDEYIAYKGWWADGSDKDGKPLSAKDWPLAQALQNKMASQATVEIEPHNQPGIRKTLLLHATPVHDSNGQVTGAVVSQVDITRQIRTEVALRESEAKFRTITDAMPQMVWSTLPDGSHEYFNQRCYEFTGVPHGALDGNAWADMLHPDDLERTWKRWQHSLSTGETYEILYRLRHHSGQHRWTLARALPIHDENGKIVRWMGTCTDIHEQKETENRLAEVMEDSERRRRLYETFLSHSPDLAYVFDLNHRFTYANEVLLQMWGRSWDDAIGKNCLELGYEPWHAEMHGREIEQIKATKKPIRGEVPFDGTFGRRIYDYIFVPVLGPDGEVEAIAGTTRDVTERKTIEEALRKNEAHLLSLFDQTAAGICEVDLTGKIINVNQHYCKITGRSHDDLIGRSMQELTHPEDLPRNLPFFQRMAETGEPFEIEKRYIRPDSSIVWVNVAVSLIRAVNECEQDTALAVVLDITERKKAEAALIDASRRKDEFLAMLAHELRNPLAPISAAAEILEMVQLDEARIKSTSQIISRQVQHMSNLIEDLLDVSRVTRGLVTLNKSAQDLKSIVSNAIEQVRPLVESRRHHLSLNLAAESAFVLGDQKRLVQIVTNLLNNAAKYTPAGGNIQLEMKTDGDAIRLSIVDDGAGIAPELQRHIFDLFTQAERTPDRSQGGLGIGLALVKSLTELHGGSVECYSAGFGKGSCFTIVLPKLPEHKNVADGPLKGRQLPQADTKLRILVVDDNIDAANMLSFYLEASGHEVIMEHGSRRALERARLEKPDVCILDIGLPEIDGFELARRLKKQSETAHTRLIAVTGYGQEQDRQASREAGFDHHLVKPVNTQMLHALLT